MSHGIEFDETMQGPFALGETEPEHGRDKGKAEGTHLAMHASVSVADLGRFIADPQHTGGLSGKIDFAPLGKGLAASRGVFNLFSPTDDPRLKLMIYELGFQVAGKDYYLAGRKKVKDDRGFDLWSDTTTLYTTLHEGRDRSATVVGAGVLSLGVGALTDLLSTVRVTGTRSAAEKAATVLKFGQFFMGELWDTYGPEVLRHLGGER